MEVCNLFNNFELDDLNEYDKHIKHIELTDEELYNKQKYYNSLEEEVIENMQS